MNAKITEPSATSGGISVDSIRLQVDSDNATPISPKSAPTTHNTATGSAPKGPDGNDLVLNSAGTAWEPAKKKTTYTNDQMNTLTENGTNTSDVLERGVDAVFLERQQEGGVSGSGEGPQVLNSSGSSSNTSEGITPGAFTATTKLIGQQLWEYRVVLLNHSQKEYVLPTYAIKQLCIEDDYLSWPLRGSIVIDNRLEAFERSPDAESFYFLRSDARDEIRITVSPKVEKGELPDKIWKIDLEAIIYDVEDLPHSDMALKAKKFYFWDKKFQNLIEKNIQWCTSTGKRFTDYTSNYPCPKPIAHATDIQRSMYTGEAIASLLYEAGYDKFIDKDNWNWGKGRIQFTAKATWTIWDCIQYILRQQISNDDKGDICIMKWDRGSKKWQLLPMWELFKDAGKDKPGKLQLEHMFFEENVTEQVEIVVPSKAPLDLNPSFVKDIKADEFNHIRNYRFSQTSGLDNSKAFVSHPVYSHWHKKKQFNVEAKDNEISRVKENYFKKNYVEKLLSVSKYPVMTMNKTKTEQKSINPQFSPVSTLDPKLDSQIRSLEGRGKILYAGLFLNQSLSIRMIGSTHRMSGSFIGVDRAKTTSDTIYDYQLCGQYFVTTVKHIFQQQKYINDIVMVKVHAYDDLLVNEGIE